MVDKRWSCWWFETHPFSSDANVMYGSQTTIGHFTFMPCLSVKSPWFIWRPGINLQMSYVELTYGRKGNFVKRTEFQFQLCVTESCYFICLGIKQWWNMGSWTMWWETIAINNLCKDAYPLYDPHCIIGLLVKMGIVLIWTKINQWALCHCLVTTLENTAVPCK